MHRHTRACGGGATDVMKEGPSGVALPDPPALGLGPRDRERPAAERQDITPLKSSQRHQSSAEGGTAIPTASGKDNPEQPTGREVLSKQTHSRTKLVKIRSVWLASSLAEVLRRLLDL